MDGDVIDSPEQNKPRPLPGVPVPPPTIDGILQFIDRATGGASDEEKLAAMHAHAEAEKRLARQIRELNERMDALIGLLGFWSDVFTEWAKSGKTGVGTLHSIINDMDKEQEEQDDEEDDGEEWKKKT